MIPPMLGLASTRVALPLDLAEDGPIYVNAKQYHGILRRRQSRAKLEAQNKLIKNRKVCRKVAMAGSASIVFNGKSNQKPNNKGYKAR